MELKPKKTILKSSVNEEKIILLPYHFKKQITSEDPLFPLNNLALNNIANGGWISQKSCKYPQKLIVKFEKSVNIRKINIIVNESKIPTKIQFINCIQEKESENDNENTSHNKGKFYYENIGFIAFSSNDDNVFQNRESREIRIDINNTKRIKLLVYENYKNSYNTYNQVGIVSLEFLGSINEHENTNNEEYEYEEIEVYEEEEEDEEPPPKPQIQEPKQIIQKKDEKIAEQPKENNESEYIEITDYEEEEEEEDDDEGQKIPQKEEPKKIEEIKIQPKKEEKIFKIEDDDDYEYIYEDEEEEEDEESVYRKKLEELKKNSEIKKPEIPQIKKLEEIKNNDPKVGKEGEEYEYEEYEEEVEVEEDSKNGEKNKNIEDINIKNEQKKEEIPKKNNIEEVKNNPDAGGDEEEYEYEYIEVEEGEEIEDEISKNSKKTDKSKNKKVVKNEEIKNNEVAKQGGIINKDKEDFKQKHQIKKSGKKEDYEEIKEEKVVDEEEIPDQKEQKEKGKEKIKEEKKESEIKKERPKKMENKEMSKEKEKEKINDGDGIIEKKKKKNKDYKKLEDNRKNENKEEIKNNETVNKEEDKSSKKTLEKEKKKIKLIKTDKTSENKNSSHKEKTENEEINQKEKDKPTLENLFNYNSNKIIKNANIKYIGIPLKKEKRESKEIKENNNIILLDNKMEKIKKLIEDNEKEKNIQDNKQFKSLQNQIDELKEILNKIYNNKNNQEKENNLQKNNTNFLRIDPPSNDRYISSYQNLNRNLSPIARKNTSNLLLTNRANESNDNLIKKKIKATRNKLKLPSLNYLSFEDLPILKVKNKPYNYNSENEKDKENNYNGDSLYISNEEMSEEKSIDEIPSELYEKYDILIKLLGEDIFKKLFSNNIFKQEEAFKYFIEKIKDIIIEPKTMEDANKYIVCLINIIIMFLDDKHPIIVMKCLELFISILKAIEEKSDLTKTEFNFKIAKHLILKIKEKLSHISKRIRSKAAELYSIMLESNLCDFYQLVSNLIENETSEYYYKIDVLNNGISNLKMNKGIEINRPGKNIKLDTNKNLILTKMNIFLKIFTNYERGIKKFNIKKFPKKIVGDYIIININNTKEEIRDITKKVLLKYINIFGNDIFYKLKLVIGNKQLVKVIHDNNSLIQEMKKFEFDRGQKIKESKIILSKLKSNNRSLHLSPLKIERNNNNYEFNMYNSPNSSYRQHNELIRSLSQPKYAINTKNKLKPIN